jgi:hypothetical protein
MMLAILLLVVAGITMISVLFAVGSSTTSNASKVGIVITDAFMIVVEVLAAIALM